MDVKNFRIEDLKPYDKNPRRNDNAVDAVANSIKKFGFKVPCVIDADNIIVCGHTRFKAAQKLGLNSVPCIVADDLSPDEIKAFRLADNKAAELAAWDFELLANELADIGIGLDMNEFGFAQHDISDIDCFFEQTNSLGSKKTKIITCPHCGKNFEP